MLILPCSLTKNGIQENLQVVIQTVEAQNSTGPYIDGPQRSGFFLSLLKEVFLSSHLFHDVRGHLHNSSELDEITVNSHIRLFTR